MKIKFCPLLLTSLMLLMSCSNNNCQAKITIDGPKGNIYSPDQVSISETLHSFNDKEFNNNQVMPSIGDVNIIVIPILIPTYETIDIDNDGIDDKELVRQHIEKAFFSTDDEQINYFSLKDYYFQSSYQKLNINGIVTPWLDLKDYGYTSASEITYLETINFIENNLLSYLDDVLNINLKDYDSDLDGYIDGIWFVYSTNNYTNGGPKLDDNNYWAYTAWANSETIGDVDNPIPNLFGWASYDFMYAYYEEENINEIKIDSHTFIHETGHFLGLKDYYGENGYNPIGGADMMDRSIIDHNSYSKMLLGWSKPYLVYGAGQIDISSMDKENSFIVVLDDNAYDNNGQFNPFDEYILIELYTTEGLNNKDSTYTLSKNKNYKAPDEIGIRIYHVDKRVYFLDASSYNWTISLYDGQQLLPDTGLVTPITNSRAKGLYEIYFGLSSSVTLYDEIRLINKSGVDTFSSGGLADNNSLFKKGDVFSLEKYSKQFYDASFNNNNPFTKSIIVEDIYE